MTTQPTITRSHLDDRVRGRVIVPGDDDYDERRTAFMGGIDRRPAAIVMAADADDVARTVMFASETGVELAVRSGGHSGAGHSTTEGGILLDLRDLRALEIDVDARTAWVQPGLTAAEYTAEAGTHGLATGFGDAGSVGIGGITVGGGVGFLSRKYGMTIDDLLAAEVVTADGRIRQVDADHEPDLFWAIRGGGGNFGVVTRLQLRLHPVGTVVGGMLMLPASADVIAGFIAEADRAPDELSTIANVMPAPPAPFVPEAVQGTLVVLAFMTFAGEAERGRTGAGTVPSFGGARSPTCWGRSRTRRCTCPRTRTTTLSPSAARCSSTASTTRSRRRSSNTSRRPMPRCGSHNSGCSVAPSPGSRPMRPHSRTAAARSW